MQKDYTAFVNELTEFQNYSLHAFEEAKKNTKLLHTNFIPYKILYVKYFEVVRSSIILYENE